ncbi:MAG: DsrE family protein [Halanaerobiales bacterium]
MSDNKELYILWTNADLITSEKMVFMYSINGMIHNWWKEVTIVIWGATAKLAAENELIQEKIKQALHVGIKIIACKGCSDQLNVSEKLESLGVEVIYWGVGLTDVLQDDKKLLTV